MHVLIVDDEVAIREALGRKLESSGLTVTLSHGVEDALRWLRQMCFDLVLTDFNMPDGNGGTIVREALIRCPEGKIALMSGNLHGVPSVVAKCAHQVFQKPDILFSIDQLVALCRTKFAKKQL